MSRRWTYFFAPGSVEGDPERKDVLGDKGSGLASMCKAGMPVPPGFTISTECCQLFLESDRWPEGLESEVREQLARLEKISARNFGGQPPLLLAVRSGAAAPMPGMMDSILNCGLNPEAARPDDTGFWNIYLQFIRMFGKTVAGITPAEFAAAGRELASELKADHRGHHAMDPHLLAERYARLYTLRTDQSFPATPWTALEQSIEAVFRSWNNVRASTYRREHDLRGCNGTAVTVQVMFPSQVSGIVFTMNPNHLDANELIVESSYGLGEGVVSGDVHPDSFTLDRQTLVIHRRVIGHKVHRIAAFGDDSHAHNPDAPSLTDAQVQELSRMALDIEASFDKPMDIEFGHAEGQFAILQLRPMSGLDVLEDVEVGRKKELYRLRELAGTHRRVWVAHNLGETLPAPTPLTWDIVRSFMRGDGGFGHMYRDLGYRPCPDVGRHGFLELIGGRIYTDPGRAAKLFWSSMPLCYDLDAVAKNPRLLESAPTTFDPFRVNLKLVTELPRLVVRMLWCSRKMRKLRKIVVSRYEQEILPAYVKWVMAKRAEDLRKLNTNELCVELHARIARVLTQFGGESLKPGFFGGLANASLTATLTQLMGREAGTQLALTLTQGLEGDTSFSQSLALGEVAHGTRSMESFLDEYGHRGVEEMELAEPRWREDPAFLRQIIAMQHGHAGRHPDELHRRNVERRKAAEHSLRETLRHWGGSCLYEEVLADLADAQRLLPYRESGKHHLMMGYETIRQVILELARRWNLDRDIFFLTRDEFATFERRRDELTSVIASRILRWQSAKRLDMAEVIDSQELEEFGLPRHFDPVRELHGEPISAGVASGVARIVFDPMKMEALPHDFVLVCHAVDPGWSILFRHARALIVERGSVLSHGAIAARDFGIPALVCPDATRRISNGARIRVDGNRGLISMEGGHV